VLDTRKREKVRKRMLHGLSQSGHVREI
jgi:hypothetical protein